MMLKQVERPERFSPETRDLWEKTEFDPVDDPRAVVLAFEQLQRKMGEFQSNK
jgi:hypothetical protein